MCIRDRFNVVYKLGKPDSVTFIPFDSNGKTIPVLADDGVTVTDMVRTEYSSHSRSSVKSQDPRIWEDIKGKLATKKDGLYFIRYELPLTYWFFGLKDDYTHISFEIKNGQVTPSIDFPKHFWQKWFS